MCGDARRTTNRPASVSADRPTCVARERLLYLADGLTPRAAGSGDLGVPAPAAPPQRLANRRLIRDLAVGAVRLNPADDDKRPRGAAVRLYLDARADTHDLLAVAHLGGI